MPKDTIVRFVDWPHYELTIKGKDFDGGVPTRVMPPIIKLQRTIDGVYARSVYGTERRLARKDREQTELIVRFEQGSTRFWSDLTPGLNAALSKIDGDRAIIIVLGVVAIIEGASIWKQYIEAETHRREIDYRIEMSRQETKRLGVVVDLADRYGELEDELKRIRQTQEEFMKRLQENDKIEIGGQEIIDGDIARKIIRSPRPEKTQDRLDGVFIILSVESGNVTDGFRARVREIHTKDVLKVSIPKGTLPPEQIAILQSGEWDKVPLRMKINILRQGNRVVKATLISAGLSRDVN